MRTKSVLHNFYIFRSRKMLGNAITINHRLEYIYIYAHTFNVEIIINTNFEKKNKQL